ncbi:serine/threonine protein kinase [Cladophialophora chaetospira]|uniref:non-specific serine/threonine protein kinase n=1 Tax=Cladophialophora chaetospira TaxID=386627 RepID=A0AA38XCC5_9EURO|nr:serine/threonine protein kinase [Cladophialophora chaetospira]
MADLSLGPLRIANPDDASPDTPLQTKPPEPQFPRVSPLADADGRTDYLSAAPQRSHSPVSPMETEPMASPNDPHSLAITSSSESESTPTQPNFSQRNASSDRLGLRPNIPYSYQDQQQAQFPQYPTMMPQNLHDPRANASRPGSAYYTQMPVNGSSANGVSRQGSYRVRSDGPGSSGFPQRSSSKRAGLGDVAGVPSGDANHTERAYGTGPYTLGNAPLPPRRTSRGVLPTRAGSTTAGNTPLSTTPRSIQTPLSTSPYNLEDRPLTNAEDWQERGAAVGVRREVAADGTVTTRPVKKGVKDFNFGQTLGEGSYSTVLAASDRSSGREYAIKVLDKKHIIKEKKVKYVNIEKDTLNRLTDHPGVVRLYYTFQDERSLYFVLDLCPGGELLGVLKRMSTFDEECSRFYGAQILDTIEYMHSRGVIHRDLKPENLLLDGNRHIKVTDFGTAKLLPERRGNEGQVDFEPDSTSNENRASSFVGTAEYVSPELLTDKNACKASDMWAFGCIVYQLLAGRPPFKAVNDYQTFQKIVGLDYDFPRGFPEVARDLVERLLVLDPQRRLSLEHAKNHPFFTGVKWGRGLWEQKAPRLKSYVPPTQPPIKLNGGSTQDNFPPDITSGHSTHSTMLPPSTQRPQPRVITELPPPSQLDIEWSPVLTRNNERILKLGNLSVVSSPNPHSPHNGDGGGKLSKWFGGSNSKKRQRLVMVTSSARIIIAAAGGEEKKSKSEISLLSPGTEYSSATDTKGVTQWFVNTKDRHYVFEDPRPPSSEPMATAIATQEWLDMLGKARDFAMQQNNNYSNDDSLNISTGALSSHTSIIDQPTDLSPHSAGQSHSGRGILHKQHSADADSLKGRKRFSKRQSKSGLTAVF